METKDLGIIIAEVKELIRISELKSRELEEAKVKLEFMNR